MEFRKNRVPISRARAAAPLLSLLVVIPACSADVESDAMAATEDRVEDERPAEIVRDPVLVRVEPVKVAPIEHKLEVTATVESLDVVDVIPERAEPVLEILVEEGDRVEKDQPLALLRTDVCQLGLAEAQVRLQEARDDLAQSRRDYDRDQALAKDQDGNVPLITTRELETSAQNVVVKETAFEAAQVAVDRAQFDLNQCTLRSPIAGTITARDVSPGDYATVGQRAFQVTDLSAPKAIFFRPQRELAMLSPGQRLEATSEAMPGVTITGSIERVSPTIDARSGTVKVTAALDADNVTIPTGILVRIVLVLDRHEQALLIPKRALLYEGRRPYCFVARNGEAVRVEITPGFEDPDSLEALPGENCVLPEDQVVVVGADRLTTGDPVELAEE